MKKVILSLLCLACLSACMPRKYSKGELPGSFENLLLPPADELLQTRISSFARHQMKIATEGKLYLHGRTVKGSNLRRYLNHNGFTKASQSYARADSFWRNFKEAFGALTFMAGSSYFLASPLQNVRDNALWRDGALITVPLGIYVLMADWGLSTIHAETALAYNIELMERLGLTPEDLPRDVEHPLSLPKAAPQEAPKDPARKKWKSQG